MHSIKIGRVVISTDRKLIFLRLAYAPCAPHVRLMCDRLGADGYLRFSLVSYNWRVKSLNGFCDSGTADISILDPQQPTTAADDGIRL
jgi:hypothetical protein